jgi:hypothetical protein
LDDPLGALRTWLTRHVAPWRAEKGERSQPSRTYGALAIARRRIANLGALSCRIAVPNPRWSESVRALATAIAGALADVGATVGCIGLVPDEEPFLVALAPRRDLVAARVEAVLGWTGAHRRPHVWVTLPRGAYLASVIASAAPFIGREPEIVELLACGRIVHALRTEVVAGRRATTVRLELWAQRRAVRGLVASAHRALRESER